MVLKMLDFELQHCDYDDIYINGVANNSAAVDAAFRKITKNTSAFLIWKIEDMNVVALPKEQYGKFYDNDSYIVFASSNYGQPSGMDVVPREIRGGNPEYHIHFWLGAETTLEKSGVAAYKTVELDNFLNCCTTQHRETQGYESARFKSYFKNGFRVLKQELITYDLPKLYKITGKRTPVLTQMDRVSWEKFNSGNIFLLHTNKYLYVWIGRAANAAEKLHASKISLEMKDQYKINNIIFMDDGYEKSLPDEEKNEFSKYLPLEKRHVLPENLNEYDIPVKDKKHLRLYKCAENQGRYRVAEIKSGPLSQSDLNPNDVYIVDQDKAGIFVWVGKRVSDKERNEALRNARGFVKKKKYPNFLKVTRVVDGHEPLEFKMLFAAWCDESKASNKAAKTTVLVSKFDAATMEDRPALAAETQLIDDGSGTVTLWRINQNTIIEVPKERHGYFFNGDCYIVLYSYQTTSKQKHLLYYWLGSQATQEEITNAALKTHEIDLELEGIGFQARVIQGREPPHFLQIFKGKLMIFKGRGLDYDETGRNLKHPSQYFLKIYGSTPSSSKAVQISPKSSLLDSNYCFVLKRGKYAQVWCGNYSTGDQREMAKLFAGKYFELIMEGKEKGEFFEILGGKTPYNTSLKKAKADPRPARLFHCFSVAGGLRVEEILFFSQNDLMPEDLMFLDYFECLYIWIGNLSLKEDQRNSLKNAIEYLENDPAGRDLNIPIIQINQSREPPTFSGFFTNWNQKFWKHYKTFTKIRQDYEKKHSNKGQKNGFHDNGKVESHSDFDQYDKYPIDVLKEPNDKLPGRVDPLNKELHLTHDDFVTMFKMSYNEFEKLPKWKQQELKKKVGLF